jgi:hypothetical protein
MGTPVAPGCKVSVMDAGRKNHEQIIQTGWVEYGQQFYQ